MSYHLIYVESPLATTTTTTTAAETTATDTSMMTCKLHPRHNILIGYKRCFLADTHPRIVQFDITSAYPTAAYISVYTPAEFRSIVGGLLHLRNNWKGTCTDNISMEYVKTNILPRLKTDMVTFLGCMGSETSPLKLRSLYRHYQEMVSCALQSVSHEFQRLECMELHTYTDSITIALSRTMDIPVSTLKLGGFTLKVTKYDRIMIHNATTYVARMCDGDTTRWIAHGGSRSENEHMCAALTRLDFLSPNGIAPDATVDDMVTVMRVYGRSMHMPAHPSDSITDTRILSYPIRGYGIDASRDTPCIFCLPSCKDTVFGDAYTAYYRTCKCGMPTMC